MRMQQGSGAGHPASAFVRLATLADMAAMAAQYLDHEEWTTINADLNVTAFRDPLGDLIGIRGLHKNDGDGIGLSEAVLYDLGGRVGRATASINEIACSAVVMELPNGVFMTTIPLAVAASTSMLSTPMPARPITLRFSAASRTFDVTLVAERTASPS